MRVKHAVMIGLLGQQRDRFHTYTEPRPLTERLEMLRRIQKTSTAKRAISALLHLIEERLPGWRCAFELAMPTTRLA